MDGNGQPMVFTIQESSYVASLWEGLKKAYAKAICTTGSSSEMARVSETTRSKAYCVLTLCRAERETQVQSEIRSFVRRGDQYQ